MTIQAQISLSDELFDELKRRAPEPETRSYLISEALRYFFATHQQTNELKTNKPICRRIKPRSGRRTQLLKL